MGGGERCLEKKRPHLSGPTGKLFLVLSTKCSIKQSCEVEEQTGGRQNSRSGVYWSTRLVSLNPVAHALCPRIQRPLPAGSEEFL